MIDWLKFKYERILADGEGAMTVRRGKVHDYLGMTLNYSVPRQVTVDMVDYVKQMVSDFEKYDDSEKTATTPAAEHLCQVREDAPKISDKSAKIFHHFAARALFTTKRARPDIHTATSFLTTRVHEPDKDDWKKLQRMMRYLKGCPGLVLTLGRDDDGTIKYVRWWIDGAHAVHANMRGQTGATCSLGKGCVMSNSLKHKINSRSSMETKIISVDAMMGQVLWTNYFLEAQGYAPEKTIVYQDNKSAILLETNGRASSSKRTKHVNVRYFFIMDRVASGEVFLEHCPTLGMIADFSTKPLQGALFIKMRNIIMDIKT